MTPTEIARKPATVALLPWLDLSSICEVSGVRFAPVAAANLSADEQIVLVDISSRYWEADKATIRDYSVAQLLSKSAVDNLTDPEVDHLFVAVDLLTFAGLARREYFSYQNYWNAHNFRLAVADTTSPPDLSKGYRIYARRRDGRYQIGTSRDAYKEMIPHHVKTDLVEVDLGLLAALDAISQSGVPEWQAIQEAIAGFNLANTDSPDMPDQTELILMLGAMQRLLDTGSEEKKLRARFAQLFIPNASLVASNPPCARCDAKKHSSAHLLKGKQLNRVADTWLQDYCNLRGNHAHGKLNSPYVPLWSVRNHLLLASYILPYLVKARLQELGFYTLTPEDQSHIDVFEALACEEHFENRDTESAEAELEGKPKPHPWDLIQRKRLARLFVAQGRIPAYADPWYDEHNNANTQSSNKENDSPNGN